MKRVIEAHEKFIHFEANPFRSFLECSLLLGLLVGVGLEMHVGHGLGLEHDLGLGIDPSYKPCWDHIRFDHQKIASLNLSLSMIFFHSSQKHL